jgi:hypothetical protein
MSEPDVIGDDRGRNRGVTAVVVVLVLGLVVALAVNSLRHKGSSGAAAPPSSSAPSIATPTPTAQNAGPDIVLRIGDGLDEVVGGQLIAIGDLPVGTGNVWATTLSETGSAASDQTLHVLGVHDGRAFRADLPRFGRASFEDLGAADQVLQTQEYPVLVHLGDPVTVGAPGANVPLPAGWTAGRFENLGYAGLLLRSADDVGNVEIASWSPGGIPHPLTRAGRLLGITDGGQAMWLDPTCPGGPRCALFFGDLGGLHPGYGLQAPNGTEFTPEPAALGGGGYLAATATTGANSVLILVEPWRDTAVIMPDSEGVVPSAGMFWLDGEHLVFVAGRPEGLRLMLYDARANTSRPFGPSLPDDVRLLTAYGSTGGVTVLP